VEDEDQHGWPDFWLSAARGARRRRRRCGVEQTVGGDFDADAVVNQLDELLAHIGNAVAMGQPKRQMIDVILQLHLPMRQVGNIHYRPKTGKGLWEHFSGGGLPAANCKGIYAY